MRSVISARRVCFSKLRVNIIAFQQQFFHSMGPTHLHAGRTGSRGGPSPGTSSQAMDHAQALRTQIQKEIEEKAKVCSNTQYECTLPRVDSYAYCFRHILQDPDAPYKQCEYEFANGRRCLEPSPKYDAKRDYGSNYCFEHSRQTQLIKTKSTIGKLVPVETTETLLNGLTHHVKVDKVKQHYLGSSTPLKITVHEDDDDTDVDVVTPSVDPFVDVDVTTVNDAGRIILDYASDSSDEDEALANPTYGSTWKAHEMDNSDNESVDSQSDDPLKHAGIYTAEEATRITKEKLTRLQTLYIEQIHRLQHVLRERRRNYLREQRAERDYHCSIFDQVKQTPRERMLYEQLKGLNRYHRKHGVEAILQRKYLEKRAKATEGLQQKPPSLPKCAYTEGGVKCGERTLPCCKHCRKHILEDKKQVLFRACGIEKSGVVCQEPLAGLFENVTCPLHMELPAQRSFNKRKYESESEGEGEVSGMEPPVVVVAGVEKSSAKAANETNAATTQAGAPEDKKAVKVEPKAGGDGTVDAKAPVKVENNKRKVIKTEPVTPVPRVRNTRSSRAAMAMQEDAPAEQPAPEQQAAEGELKKEQTEAKENENNVTSAAATVDQTDDGIVDLEESLLPVSIIPNKNLKPDEATVAEQVGEMDTMDTSTEAAESAKEAMETETTDERQAEPPSTVPDQPKEGADGDKKEEEKNTKTEEATEESSVAAEKEEPTTTTTTTITATENSQPKDADDTSTTAPVEESASTAPKESDARTDQTPKAQPKPQPSPLTARQRKLRLATDRKESAAKGTNETATTTATDEVSGTSDEEKAKKAKAGKAEPSSGSSSSSSSAAGGSGSEQKSRRQK
ncbi:uncharacterized protein LOC1277269 isoform X1 [Anopheles gambiae]|uniref:uncharacterized protein LOC1277269 isoform X1 n=2 Tax=Anopheles gambiae TaxID=7165 RepID=UPI002AC9C7E0|nr:uncharacterized protein LOC1277269 isoform X1 [Anopheles gambiae]